MAVKRTTPNVTKAPPARKPRVRRTPGPAAVTQEEIATRAYFLHLDGVQDPFENWLRAERELVG